MNKKAIILAALVIALVIIVVVIAGNKNNQINGNDSIADDIVKEEESNSVSNIANTNKEGDSVDIVKEIKATINQKEYTVTLENNETVAQFLSILPQEFQMNELNGNEKYVYLDTTLPTNGKNPGRIETGDIMLFGDNCLVVFYKSFSTPYSYTKIGHIQNLPDLGNKNITVSFEK